MYRPVLAILLLGSFASSVWAQAQTAPTVAVPLIERTALAACTLNQV